MKRRTGEKRLAALHRRFLRNSEEFVSTELDVSITFASLALRSSDETRRLAFAKHALTGYESFFRFLPLTSLASQKNALIAQKVAWLKAALIELGQDLTDF